MKSVRVSVFTFYSRPLHEQIRNYITRFVQEFSQGEVSEPDWNKVRIWYGWGAYNWTLAFSGRVAKRIHEPFSRPARN